MNINFIGKNKFFGTLSVGLVILSGYFIFTKGLNYGIDFSGGSEMQVRFEEEVSSSKIKELLVSLDIDSSQVQQLGDSSEYLIRFENQSEEEEEGAGKVSELRKLILDQFQKSRNFKSRFCRS